MFIGTTLTILLRTMKEILLFLSHLIQSFMGHQISYDGEKVFNLTLNDETDAVIKLESNEKGAYSTIR